MNASHKFYKLNYSIPIGIINIYKGYGIGGKTSNKSRLQV